MIPGSFVGLALFVLTVGPGYVYIRIVENKTRRVKRSTLLEAAELVVVGGGFTAASLALVSTVADLSGWINLSSWLVLGHVYVVRSPLRVVSFGAAVLAVSYILAASVAYLAHRGEAPTLFPNLSVW